MLPGAVTRAEAWGPAYLIHAPGEYLVALSEGTATTGQPVQATVLVGVLEGMR